MDDLIARLRDECTHWPKTASLVQTLTQAAADIERLRRELDEAQRLTVERGDVAIERGNQLIQARAELAALRERHERDRAALAELVACKDLHDKLEVSERDDDYLPSARTRELRNEYERRRSAAWADARAALQEPQP
jgi:hypothetical protein